MALAGYNTLVEITGTTTAFTGEAFGGSGAGPYQVTDAVKRVWNPDVALTFYDGGTPIAAADVLLVDSLFGEVTFTGSKTGPITADGSYFPRYATAETKEFSIAMSRSLLDVTIFDPADKHHKYHGGLIDASGNLGSLDDCNTDMDSTGNARKFFGTLDSGTKVVLSIFPGASGDIFRAWVLLSSIEVGAQVDGLVESQINWELASQQDSLNFAASYKWNT